MVFLTHRNAALAISTQVNIYKLEENNSKKSIGSIKIEENIHGLIFIPNLSTLSEGMHSFQIHVHPSCDTKDSIIGGSAGGYYDLEHTRKHLEPYNVNGYLGDLRTLYVDKQGNTVMSVLALRLKKKSEIKEHSLVIHLRDDNQSDKPLPLGGNAARLACGIIET
ncbi:Cu-Zn family superoxide dismutase [Bartonella fuyuanensis]|uniref:Cu-Zn family superoxide dismutase n=1 Tax=Bartonella fuyuanensis TaxID=1460968 RepID=A0A840E5I1_9HYPH|nr:superoxide dismutase family protein [Bartonella fuyuanensis]MBB4076406.1 Cu-Zn family superoxide dismutase [Bartonella fuyuanensis]